MLEGTRSEIAAALRDEDPGNNAVTEKLLKDGQQVVCWTCGSEVDRDEIEETLDRLRSLREEKMSRRSSLQAEIEATQEKLSNIEQNEQRTSRLERRPSEIDSEIARNRDRISELEERRESLRAEADELETEIEEEESTDYGDLTELHNQANTIEIEIKQKTDELADVEAEISEVESLTDERDELERRREDLSDQLTELRNRITNIEEGAVTAFNEHMEELLEVLGYENVARIWIERTEREVRQGRQKVTKSEFDLHVVREAESGTTYEGTVETLSEIERKVAGLVFALAGYLVHDVYEEVSVMLLDSLEAIDAERINRLIDCFSEYPTYLVVAVLPEDADAVDVDDEVISEF